MYLESPFLYVLDSLCSLVSRALRLHTCLFAELGITEQLESTIISLGDHVPPPYLKMKQSPAKKSQRTQFHRMRTTSTAVSSSPGWLK